MHLHIQSFAQAHLAFTFLFVCFLLSSALTLQYHWAECRELDTTEDGIISRHWLAQRSTTSILLSMLCPSSLHPSNGQSPLTTLHPNSPARPPLCSCATIQNTQKKQSFGNAQF